MESLLKLDNCTIRFGGLTAVASFSMEIRRELISLIDPTVLERRRYSQVTGVYRPTEGDAPCRRAAEWSEAVCDHRQRDCQNLPKYTVFSS
jgi:ABC-type branched-subunit amino acid transport system ATPase component